MLSLIWEFAAGEKCDEAVGGDGGVLFLPPRAVGGLAAGEELERAANHLLGLGIDDDGVLLGR